MRQLIVDKEQYDDFLYPAVAVKQPPSILELRLQMKVLDKLEAVGTPTEKTKEGSPSRMTGYVLSADTVTFDFEDNEADLVVRCLEAQIPQLMGFRSRHLVPLIEQLQKK